MIVESHVLLKSLMQVYIHVAQVSFQFRYQQNENTVLVSYQL